MESLQEEYDEIDALLSDLSWVEKVDCINFLDPVYVNFPEFYMSYEERENLPPTRSDLQAIRRVQRPPTVFRDCTNRKFGVNE